MTTLLITGGAGFIGSALVRQLIAETDGQVANIDALTYAGNLESLGAARKDARHRLHRVDICDASAVRAVFATERPSAVLHLAAESHVDRSIDEPGAFVREDYENCAVGSNGSNGTHTKPKATPDIDLLVKTITDQVLAALKN